MILVPITRKRLLMNKLITTEFYCRMRKHASSVNSRRELKRFLLAVFLLLWICLPAALCEVPEPLNREKVITLINGMRAELGILPLKFDQRLAVSSRAKVTEMVDENYFGHTNPEGESFSLHIRRVPYRYRYAGEILAKIMKPDEERLMAIWKGSPPHRRSILDPRYSDIGCASAVSEDGFYYLVACHLGKPK